MDVPIRRWLQPHTLEEALRWLAELPDARAMAGGTDLVVHLRDGRGRADTAPPLLVADASLRLASRRGFRARPLTPPLLVAALGNRHPFAWLPGDGGRREQEERDG